MDFISLFAPRLKIERKRLGLSQAEAAQVCGVSREIWGKYERAMAVPGGDVIFAFASAGADIHFVMTGARSAVSLSDDEEELLALYRGASLTAKTSAVTTLQTGVAPTQERMKVTFKGRNKGTVADTIYGAGVVNVKGKL